MGFTRGFEETKSQREELGLVVEEEHKMRQCASCTERYAREIF